MLHFIFRNPILRFKSLLFQIVLIFLLLPTQYVLSQSKEKRDENVWAEVDRLTNEQKFQAALDASKVVLRQAKAEKKSQLWAEALVKCTNLQMGLAGFETAVRFLKEESWPGDLEHRVILNLYYAQSLISYTQNYRWEILQREKVQSKAKVDLKAWTLEELALEIRNSLDLAVADEGSVSKPTSDFMRSYLRKGSYPDYVKPWLRSTVVDLMVSFLSDSTYWTPTQSANLYKIDFKSLILNSKKQRIPTSDVSAHPVEILASWLHEHSRRLAAKGLSEAALDSKYTLMERLYALTSDISVRDTILKQLLQLQNENRKNRWWSRGQAILAQFYQQQPESAFSRMIDAMRAAELGAKEYPDSIGAKQCLNTMAAIRMGQYQLDSMQTDGLNKKSIALEYKNLKKMYFRAYRIEIEKALPDYKPGYILGTGSKRDIRSLLNRKADFEWSEDLKDTPDYLMHRSFIKPPIKGFGYYQIFASSTKTFDGQENEVKAVDLLLSDYVVSYSAIESQKIEIQVKSGARGVAIENAEVVLYRFDYNSQASIVSTVKTNQHGIATIAEPPRENKYWNFFFIVKKADQFAFDLNSIYFSSFSNPQEHTSSLIFTDRGVYRPNQKILFKIASFKGSADSYKVIAAGSTVTVTLRDPNYQVAGKLELKSNEFGTVSGEFLIPSGKPLGHWQIQSSLSGSSSIRVEEYKRPTFEVAMKDSDTPLRLNKKAIVRGEAKYYFGQSVASGKARYRVFRSQGLMYDIMTRYRHYFRAPNLQVAQGEVNVDQNGQFVIEFTPEVEEKIAKTDARLNYNYSVQVEVTDEGGETRSSEKNYRIGFLTLEASMKIEKGFQTTSKNFSIKAQLSQLDGKPRSGNADFKIFELKQPEAIKLPAELEREKIPETPFANSADFERARFETKYDWREVVANWIEGATLQKGSFKHAATGDAEIEVEALKKSGVYRIQYEIKDDFGKPFKLNHDFIVGDMSTRLALPLVALVEKETVEVGEKARIFVRSGFQDQKVELEIYRGEKRIERKVLSSNEQGIVEIPVAKSDRGGLTVRAQILRDYQGLEFIENLKVPWKDKVLKVNFSSFRDKVRPGSKETIRISVQDFQGKPLIPGQAEVLAVMYDRSLDLFANHELGDFLKLYPSRYRYIPSTNSLGKRNAQWVLGSYGSETSKYPAFHLFSDRLEIISNYAIGGPGRRGFGGPVAMEMMDEVSMAAPASIATVGSAGETDGAILKKSGAQSSRAELKKGKDLLVADSSQSDKSANGQKQIDSASSAGAAGLALRSNFSETAFFKPHLIVGEKGQLSFEYEVPDSLTSWKLMTQAMTKDLLSGIATKEIQSVKELMVRPYLPRFLREGDLADIKVVINNSSEKDIEGKLKFDIEDPQSSKSVLALFGLKLDQSKVAFKVKAKGAFVSSFKIKVPAQLGFYSFRITAESPGLSDGELRELPVLPSRMHLAQSRFVALKKNSVKTVEFKDMSAGLDKSLINEKLVVTVDAQLFYGVLQSLPSILKSPYDCTEVVLNRFVTTGILSSFYESYPSLGKMAKTFSNRKTQLEKFDDADANRRMQLEEGPWLLEAKGGQTDADRMINVLDPKEAKFEQQKAIEKLKKLQLNSGAFPWFQGGPPDEFMTIYLLIGFARALEFKVEVPKELVKKAWAFTASWLESELARWMSLDTGWQMVTLVNFALGAYPDASWTPAKFDSSYRAKLLEYSFKHWREHSPLLKAYLALTLFRMNRMQDAQLVWDSVMDSAKKSEELGVYWAPEDRSWLWYNDTIETHAMSLRTEMEVNSSRSQSSANPAGGVRDLSEGLVQWLFMNKKLNQWKSTRATSEVIYSMAKYLEKNKLLGVDEDIAIDLGTQKTSMQFSADKYTGKKNQIVIQGEKLDLTKNSKITFSKNSPSLAFASATWHFSTEQLPLQSESDFFSVKRNYFVRENKASKGQPAQWVLKPLSSGGKVKIGDQIEVQLSLRSKHQAEYIHLRDPRAAGLEPESVVSGYKWDLGLSWLEEIRDSATNFFFSSLPVGEYTFKYRLRANMAGQFRLAPATLQSFYAPEFNAYSAGFVLNVESDSH